ncbi:UbiA family prenyltransferase [Actinocrispum wychmicini]|uniref:1,4-dihydroxy-2-naphthoate octaprenyltransferase n=1 Tax=Actinocrispum wychmicini TaxID=1213861 RepID=A0A4R2JME2_9PSEU|nr:UbiA family prenyltransferase [Actinocrispum wychmicini]TCO59782.1 1,4-dihydroxy-2-naphthoate octaprenyltransferase [Actinocrispum wychmicini]
MTSTTSPSGERLRAYVKLAKLSFWDYYTCIFVVFTLLAPVVQKDPRIWLVLVLFNLGWVGVVAATVAFDDVTGFRDGSDARNYAPSQSALRARDRKPLLDGRLTVTQALRFGWACTLAGLGLWAIAFAIAPYASTLGLIAAAVCAFCFIQYSYGLKLSYYGGQELALWLCTGLCVLVPFTMVSPQVTGLMWLESFLFGLWSLMVSVYSNINDVDGDREAGRINLATRISPAAYRGFIGGLSLLELVVIVGALAFGAAPLWFGLFLVPTVVMRARQAHNGLIAGRPLVARKAGVTIHRWGVVALMAGNLVVVHVG